MGAYFYSYQNSAISILTSYRGEEPFVVFLKNFFRKYKKFGSRDRKVISNLCFGFMRIGNAAAALSFTDQMLIGFFLTHQDDNGYLDTIKPEWVSSVRRPIREKIELVQSEFVSFEPQKIFPYISFLSDGIIPDEFSIGHLQKPSFFLRIRPGMKSIVLDSLDKSGILFSMVGDNSLNIKSNVDIEKTLRLDIDCVIQDISSQKTTDILQQLNIVPLSLWDACSGSGGKCILLSDIYPQAAIFVSDIREEILDELKRRLDLANIIPEKIFCTDLRQSLSTQVVISNLPTDGVDLIIADVPCSGSGTWRRSPEWLRSFDLEMIGEYKQQQVQIVSNLIHHLKPGGHLLYITCSVFKQENEEVVEFLQREKGMKILDAKIISGISTGGDQLFSALLTL